MKILIVRPDAIGDLVLTLPAIQAVKAHFPQAKITVLIKPYTSDLAKSSPAIDQIIYDYNLKPYKFDLSINFFNEFKDTWATFISRIPRRLGDSSRILTGWMNNLRVFRNWADKNKHEVEQNFELLKPLGIKPAETKPIINVDAAALAQIKNILRENQVADNDTLFAIHIGSATEQAWQPQGFASLINWLGQQKKFKILVLGGKKELSTLELIKAHVNVPIIDLVNKTSLAQLMAVISLVKYFVGMSTGATHLAAAFTVPTVMISLNKNSPPGRWHPWQTRYQVVTEDNPEKVITAVKSLLAD